jgi:vitamin B12 transporter
MRKTLLLVFTFIVLPLPGSALAQAGPEEEITEVVVTATRLPTPVDEVSGTILVITSDDIERKQARTVADALRGIPGIDLVNQGGLGKSSSVLLRGGETRFTLVLVDGVEVNDPSNPERTFDFAHMTTHDIERIEILFGPQSTLYGSDAIGGVIQIFTRKGAVEPTMEVSVEAGTFKTRRTRAVLRRGAGGTSYSLSASRLESDGISVAAESDGNTEKDGYENTTLSGHIGIGLETGGSLEFDVRFIDAHNELDHFGGPGGDDPNFTGDVEQLLISGRWTFFPADIWETILAVSSSSHDRRDLNEPDPDRDFTMELSFKGQSRKTEWVNNLYLGERYILTLGFDKEKETGESSFFSDESGPYSSTLDEESATINGFFLQEQYTSKSGMTITLGVRNDHHSRFGNEITWRAGLSVPASDTLRFRTVYGTGFRAPSIDQLFNPDYGNLDLEAERSRGWDTGVEVYLGRDIRTSLSWYLTEYDNLIAWFDADGDPSTWWDGSYENISRAQTEGVDLNLDAHMESVSLGITGSLLKTEDDQGEQLLRRPKTRWSGRLDLRPSPNLTYNLHVTMVGERRDWGDVTLDSYTLVNLTGTYIISDAVQMFGRIENLTDIKYEEADGYGTPGRSAYFGVKADL